MLLRRGAVAVAPRCLVGISLVDVLMLFAGGLTALREWFPSQAGGITGVALTPPKKQSSSIHTTAPFGIPKDRRVRLPRVVGGGDDGDVTGEGQLEGNKVNNPLPGAIFLCCDLLMYLASWHKRVDYQLYL